MEERWPSGGPGGPGFGERAAAAAAEQAIIPGEQVYCTGSWLGFGPFDVLGMDCFREDGKISVVKIYGHVF